MIARTLNNMSARRPGQYGVTLIELLIAMVVGLILIAGGSQIYLSNKQAYRSQEAVSYVNSNTRFAMFFMQDIINMAGFKGDPAESDADAFPAAPAVGNCLAFAKNQFVAGTNDNNGFCVRMKSASNSSGSATDVAQMTDCLGINIAENDLVTTRFFISNTNELSCQTFHTNNAGGLNQPLVSNVTITNLQFGVDTNNDKMVDFPYVANPSDWRNVIAANITMNFTSDEATSGQVTMDRNDPDNPDRLLQRNVTRTFALRSRTNPIP